ncbi:hypothetical protein N7453_000174 [Penicillium expansum]|nr:hypothetical protein N7453_000174 [Penicillium expansum]
MRPLTPANRHIRSTNYPPALRQGEHAAQKATESDPPALHSRGLKQESASITTESPFNPNELITGPHEDTTDPLSSTSEVTIGPIKASIGPNSITLQSERA